MTPTGSSTRFSKVAAATTGDIPENWQNQLGQQLSEVPQLITTGQVENLSQTSASQVYVTAEQAAEIRKTKLAKALKQVKQEKAKSKCNETKAKKEKAKLQKTIKNLKKKLSQSKQKAKHHEIQAAISQPTIGYQVRYV